jgi:hypothetical protein
MSPNLMSTSLFAGAAVALILAMSPVVSATQPDADRQDAAPIVVTQASAPATSARSTALPPDGGAVHLRGVRMAALQGPDALRRYTFRTRMIYNYDYEDWAPKP